MDNMRHSIKGFREDAKDRGRAAKRISDEIERQSDGRYLRRIDEECRLDHLACDGD